MEANKIRDCNLYPATELQLQIRGGVAFNDFFRIIRYVEMLFNFINEYKEDMERGFDKGWRMF